MIGTETLVGLLTIALTFVFLLAVVWMRRFFNARTRREIQETIRIAIQDGQSLTPEAVRAIAFNPDAERADLRVGLMLIALAAAMLVLAAVFPAGVGEDALFPAGFRPLIAGAAALPGFAGLARLVLFATRPKDVV